MEWGLDPKPDHYGTSKNFGKNKKTLNYNGSGHREDYIMYNCIGEKKFNKKNSQSYILWIKPKTCGGLAYATHKLWPKKDLRAILERM